MDPLSLAVHNELVTYVTAAAPSAKLFQHPASKTSEESMEARFQASGERVPGAKALLVKLNIRDQPDRFAVIVLPGFNKLGSKGMKNELRQHIDGLRDFRFATPEEMTRVARGLQPGKMPPFGRPLFPEIQYTFVDLSLFEHPRIGFNAADFESSIIMDSSEYRQLVEQDGIFACSVPGSLSPTQA
jgi:prolyl-tRNA editing enzyme YbaK/EbsC (Cys-tRNA(Pro) deacylase)